MKSSTMTESCLRLPPARPGGDGVGDSNDHSRQCLRLMAAWQSANLLRGSEVVCYHTVCFGKNTG